MATPKKSEKDSIESVPTDDLVRSLRKDLDVEAEKRRKEWEAKHPAKKPKKSSIPTMRILYSHAAPSSSE